LQTRKIRVHLQERSYDIEIGSNIRGELGRKLAGKIESNRGALVTDERVAELYQHGILTALSFVHPGFKVKTIVIPPGEKSKSLEQLQKLYEAFSEFGMDRMSPVIAFGGGVVGDLAGFAAATFLRGVPLIQVPTTLLADVDSSVGGKTGINIPQGKNLVGAFYQPRAVFIDTWVLRSLPRKELRCGIAEVIKYGMIKDENLFAYLEEKTQEILNCDEEVLGKIIERCCQIKAEVVEQDERESGLRSILNYGHTVGHALEGLSGFEGFSHGEAIAIGMNIACKVAVKRGITPKETLSRQRLLLEKFGLPVEAPALDTDALLSFLRRDKKARSGRLRFVLPKKIGEVVVQEVEEEEVRRALSKD